MKYVFIVTGNRDERTSEGTGTPVGIIAAVTTICMFHTFFFFSDSSVVVFIIVVAVVLTIAILFVRKKKAAEDSSEMKEPTMSPGMKEPPGFFLFLFMNIDF